MTYACRRKYCQPGLAAETGSPACWRWIVSRRAVEVMPMPSARSQAARRVHRRPFQSTASRPAANRTERVSVPRLGTHGAAGGGPFGDESCRTIRTLRGVRQVIDRVRPGRARLFLYIGGPSPVAGESVIGPGVRVAVGLHEARGTSRPAGFPARRVGGGAARPEIGASEPGQRLVEPRERATAHFWSVVEASHELWREARRSSTYNLCRFSEKIAA